MLAERLSSCEHQDMARFEPFAAVRYRLADPAEVSPLTSPPYDVFTEAERAGYASRDPRNVVRVDFPMEADGDSRYDEAARTWSAWLQEGVVAVDPAPSFYIYRMTFTDDKGRTRTTSGVVGALEVADIGSSAVLPHEQTTPKAKSDRLDLLAATRVNLSPVWGLVVGQGLTALTAEPGELVADMTDESGVRHVVERVDDPGRVAAIRANVGAAPVLIADGHHRYAVSRTYRDQQPDDPARRLTMTYVAELAPEQLSIEAIHRVLTGIPLDTAITALSRFYELEPAATPDRSTLAAMERDGTLRLVALDGRCWSMRERHGVFDDAEPLDSARLATALADTGCELEYQHGLEEALDRCEEAVTAVVLIRPVSIDAIRSIAQRQVLMPPKSTFFTPKLRTGLLFRDLDRS